MPELQAEDLPEGFTEDEDIYEDIYEDIHENQLEVELDDSPRTLPEASSETLSYTVVAEGLCKDFEDGDEIIRAVDNVTFSCTPAQFVTISGPSGCGKSTLLFLLGSLELPSEGRLIIGGDEVTELPAQELNRFRRSRVGFVFQSFHLVPNLSALENVMLPMDIAGVPRKEQALRATALLEQVGIDSNRHQHRPGKLSGGQQQRVAIARALANDPTVILADEPTGNLDSGNSKRIVELLRQLARLGRTIIVVTHDRSIAKQADLSIELEDGRIVRMTTREERERRALAEKERTRTLAEKTTPTRTTRAPKRGRR